MPKINFTGHLKRFYPELASMEVKGLSVADCLKEIEVQYAGLKSYIVDENGALRQHVNIYIGNQMVKDRKYLRDTIKVNDEIYIMQAISGG